MPRIMANFYDGQVHKDKILSHKMLTSNMKTLIFIIF